MAVEHRGYFIQQSDYNHHYMIIKDGRMVCHSQYDKPMTEDEMKEKIDIFIELMKEV